MPLGAGPREVIAADIERLIALLDRLDPDSGLNSLLALIVIMHATEETFPSWHR
jgi:hypothetical protein